MQIESTERRDQGTPILRFAVVADTHVNETEHGGSSPFVTNASANARARYVFNEISAMSPAPAFVVHLGDIVHPVPSLPGFLQAVQHFRDMTADLPMPLHVIPGNHDVGDKHIDWMPADLICEEYLQAYRKAFGPDYFSFDQGGCRFLMLNSVLFNSGLPQDQEQRDWITEQLDTAGTQRVFVFLHYPPYIHTENETGNYDNIDQPARAWLIEQLRRDSVEAVFAGHVHNFWYDRIGSAEMYMLPSTAFMRHDFSEFYKIAPAVEHARGDPERYGYFLVDVFDDRHVAYSLRTMGEQAPPEGSAAVRSRVSVAHPKSSVLDRVGVELRHPWAEKMQISATGGVQEFGRKWARNDYPLQSMWEMGVRLCKVPSVDLAEDYTAQRMSVLAATDNRFIVTCLGKPADNLLQRDLADCGVAGFEVNATAARFEAMQTDLAAVRRDAAMRVYFAKILSGDDSRFDGKHFTHFVKSGFSVAELDAARPLVSSALKAGAIDGVTIRLELTDNLPLSIGQIQSFCDALQSDALVSLKLAGPSVAQMQDDDAGLAARGAQAILLSLTHPRVKFLFDTFMDVDRGYYPRRAFIDRRFNPRLPARTFQFVNTKCASLNGLSLQSVDADGISTVFELNGRKLELAAGPADDVDARLRDAGSATGWNLLTCCEESSEQMSQPLSATNCDPSATNPNGIKAVLIWH